jgi:glycerate kinase
VTILVAPDKFKGSLTAKQVCDAIAEGAKKFDPSIAVISIPLADGGEGTCDILTSSSKGKKVAVEVENPLRRVVGTEYGISNDGQIAFIEMAKASGLQLLLREERSPMHTTTFGTGQLILHALSNGVRKIIIGIGGSATNDAGLGMASALGYRFLSGDEELEPIGKNLVHLTAIKHDLVNPLVSQCAFTVLCDVKNPLVGKNGAAHVFASQKGATANEVELLDKGLVQFQKVAEREFMVSLNFPGAGAAGGLGAGAKAFLNARLTTGFDFLADFVNLEDAVRNADLVVTGEGSLDAQSLSGKVVQGVTTLASKNGKKCIAFAGRADLQSAARSKLNLAAIISLQSDEISESEAMSRAYPLLVERVYKFLAGRS